MAFAFTGFSCAFETGSIPCREKRIAGMTQLASHNSGRGRGYDAITATRRAGRRSADLRCRS